MFIIVVWKNKINLINKTLFLIGQFNIFELKQKIYEILYSLLNKKGKKIIDFLSN